MILIIMQGLHVAILDPFESQSEIEKLRPLFTNKLYQTENYAFCTITEPGILHRGELRPRCTVSPLVRSVLNHEASLSLQP
jgi:hypothetical protein